LAVKKLILGIAVFLSSFKKLLVDFANPQGRDYNRVPVSRNDEALTKACCFNAS